MSWSETDATDGLGGLSRAAVADERAQAAAYSFTRLRSEWVWRLDVDVPLNNVGLPAGCWVVSGGTDQVLVVGDGPARRRSGEHPDLPAAVVVPLVGSDHLGTQRLHVRGP
jgi:hypothetical protein